MKTTNAHFKTDYPPIEHLQNFLHSKNLPETKKNHFPNTWTKKADENITLSLQDQTPHLTNHRPPKVNILHIHTSPAYLLFRSLNPRFYFGHSLGTRRGRSTQSSDVTGTYRSVALRDVTLEASAPDDRQRSKLHSGSKD